LNLVVLTSSQAQAERCPPHAPNTTLKAYSTQLKYFRNFSSADLTFSQTGHTDPRSRILGMAGGEIGTRLKVQYLVSTLSSGLKCVKVTKVTAKFYTKPVMFVASDYKKGSCEYRQVLKHEKLHIKTLKKFHMEYTPRYRAELKRIAKRIPVARAMPAGYVESEKDRIVGFIREHMSRFDDKIFKVLGSRQAKIDTPYEYKLVASKCRNW